MNTEIIKKMVEERTNTNLLNPTRKRNAVYARAIYFKLCRRLTRLSLNEIGATLNKNHATVLHSINNIFEEIKEYDKLHYAIYKDLKGTDKLLPLSKRYQLLLQKYNELEANQPDPKFNDMINLIKSLPDSQLNLAHLRLQSLIEILVKRN